MKYFRDTDTGAVFAFEDNVVAEHVDGAWVFSADGEPLPGPYPGTLTQTDDPTSPVVAPTPEQLTITRDALLAAAALRIAPLQDAVDLEIASAADVAKLKAWKEYRVAVSRTNLTDGALSWPVKPE
ncbi:tail fiber assembly protein [Cupriavidus sp. IDO]|uniref:tail fiber assembly protein n=1 Tax=Cupriavidus sp. IDO TaxID=1539142 RepID=UPI00068D9C5E|nr:tail fiber assembly protein [Cupriavidus sp. IDO]KWR88757.1 hypothetical protein RM96_17740 [Cupriavidus sp. IDO]